MSTASMGVALPSQPALPAPGTSSRIMSIDALRGFVMFTMIFVNDLAGAPRELTPDWMVHFSDRHRGGSGMTFVDLVFPAFLFIVGMSIPIALSGRLAKGDSVPRLLGHVITRTLALLLIGILMVNGEDGPNSELMGMSGDAWIALMFTSAMLAFCTISPPRWMYAGEGAKKACRIASVFVRLLGFVGLIWAAVVFRGGDEGTRIITIKPFSIHHSWYGILGLIGWAYLVAAICFLLFRANRTALLGCVALLLCFFIADKKGFFEGFFLNDIVGIGQALGSLASISVAGVMLGSILITPDTQTVKARTGFALLFIVGFAFAAILLTPQWGISKNNATPAWCLWSCAITALLWLLFYLAADVHELKLLAKPFAIAGENVLLAYILSEMMYSVLDLLQLGNWYGSLSGPTLANAVARSVGCSIFILMLSAGLNRVGFRLKL